MCLYGFGNVETWGKNSGHIWRTTGDIKDRWPSMLVNIDINDEKRFTSNQGPKIGWNYPDALFVGKEIQIILAELLMGDATETGRRAKATLFTFFLATQAS